jgi:hypothetical protein
MYPGKTLYDETEVTKSGGHNNSPYRMNGPSHHKLNGLLLH